MGSAMKELILVRHAKSSWKTAGVSDFDRPLNKRGSHDAPIMGRRLADLDIVPDMIVASPAKRAMDTAEIIAREMGVPSNLILPDIQIYAASASGLIRLIRQLDDDWDHVMMVGHNPGIRNTGVLLVGDVIGTFPTCAILSMELEVDHWNRAMPSCGRILFSETPNGRT